ncbi:Hypothetical protein GLP15_1159 [Giardia lamblia P15]|uniref:Thioredoxin domain-containing protein n=1 Tax=Giardia intestinalis (strain P15) TaxID=658858 RepID=E1F4Q2_GIAIA|nr:Hypothetical protein GLP15_1159 [Giardia lamblia P15]
MKIVFFLLLFAFCLTADTTSPQPDTFSEGLHSITHNEMLKLGGDLIAIYWDSAAATDQQKETLQDLHNISQAMVVQGLHPIFLIDKQDRANSDAFDLPYFEKLPRLMMHLGEENVTELMEESFIVPNIAAFVLDRIQRGNPEDMYSFISEEDLLDFYEETNRKPVLLFFTSKMCKTCMANMISIQRLATSLKDDITIMTVNCDGTLDENNYCSRILMRKFPHLLLLADDVFTNFNGTYTTSNIGSWVINELKEERKEARRKEWAEKSKETFSSEYYEEVGRNAYDKKGRPKEWPMKPNIKRTIKQMDDLERRIKKLEQDFKDFE